MKTTPNPCEATRNRLLNERQPARVPADLRPHVDTCGACQEYLARFTALTADLKALPVPDSELKKVEFRQMLESAGPIITAVPASARGTLIPWNTLWRTFGRPLTAIAASVAVGIGVWSVLPTKPRTQDVAAAPRHELLNRIVQHNATLAKAGDARTKIDTLTNLVADLQLETKNVLPAADAADIDSLAGLFEKVVSDGILKQAKDMNAFAQADRPVMLRAAAARLAETANDIAALQSNAPPPTKAALVRIHTVVNSGSHTLTQLANSRGA